MTIDKDALKALGCFGFDSASEDSFQFDGANNQRFHVTYDNGRVAELGPFNIYAGGLNLDELKGIIETLRKKGCQLRNVYCPEHEFVHGKEAEELREGIEEIIANEYDAASDVMEDLQNLLDGIDARDSLAWTEASEPEREPDPMDLLPKLQTFWFCTPGDHPAEQGPVDAAWLMHLIHTLLEPSGAKVDVVCVTSEYGEDGSFFEKGVAVTWPQHSFKRFTPRIDVEIRENGHAFELRGKVRVPDLSPEQWALDVNAGAFVLPWNMEMLEANVMMKVNHLLGSLVGEGFPNQGAVVDALNARQVVASCKNADATYTMGK